MGFCPTFSWLSLLPDSLNLPWRHLLYFTCGYNYLLPCVSLILLKIVKFVTHSFCTVHKGHSTSSLVPHPTPLFSPMFPWHIFQFISFKLLSLNFSIFLYLGSLSCLSSLFFMISFSIWIHDADFSTGWGEALAAKGYLHRLPGPRLPRPGEHILPDQALHTCCCLPPVGWCAIHPVYLPSLVLIPGRSQAHCLS